MDRSGMTLWKAVFRVSGKSTEGGNFLRCA
jgi:hypothetical protein